MTCTILYTDTIATLNMEKFHDVLKGYLPGHPQYAYVIQSPHSGLIEHHGNMYDPCHKRGYPGGIAGYFWGRRVLLADSLNISVRSGEIAIVKFTDEE
jgi:hypothetical protein